MLIDLQAFFLVIDDSRVLLSGFFMRRASRKLDHHLRGLPSPDQALVVTQDLISQAPIADCKGCESSRLQIRAEARFFDDHLEALLLLKRQTIRKLEPEELNPVSI